MWQPWKRCSSRQWLNLCPGATLHTLFKGFLVHWNEVSHAAAVTQIMQLAGLYFFKICILNKSIKYTRNKLWYVFKWVWAEEISECKCGEITSVLLISGVIASVWQFGLCGNFFYRREGQDLIVYFSQFIVTRSCHISSLFEVLPA